MSDVNTISILQNNQSADVEFREIPGFRGFRACSDGSIWSCWIGGGKVHKSGIRTDKWHKLKGEPRKEDGRLRYSIMSDDGIRTRKYGSYFVLLAFVGDRPPKHEACHNDGNCLNDAISNLRWGTVIENRADMIAHGTRCRGDRHGKAKLTSEQVREIRRIGRPAKQHFNKYGVSKSLVFQILAGTIWRDIQ